LVRTSNQSPQFDDVFNASFPSVESFFEKVIAGTFETDKPKGFPRKQVASVFFRCFLFDHKRLHGSSVGAGATGAFFGRRGSFDANLVLSQEIEKERDARTEIEERVEWRRLTKAEQSAISANLRLFSNMNGGVWFNAGDYEGNLFARDIGRAILGAGRGVLGPASKMDLMEMGAHFNVEVPSGVIITSTADQPSVDAAHTLVKAFNGLGFDCSMSPTPDSRHGLVIVTVEARPQGPQGPAKLRHLTKAH
jgi:hypothetical protein